MNIVGTKLLSFGVKLKNIRRQRQPKLSQKGFADEFGISIYTVQDWEQGKHFPRMEDLIRIAEFFDCDYDYLLGDQETPRKEYAHIAEMTGLSYSAVETLKSFTVKVKGHPVQSPSLKALDFLLVNKGGIEFKALLFHLYAYSSCVYQASLSPDPSLSPAEISAEREKANVLARSELIEVHRSLERIVDDFERDAKRRSPDSEGLIPPEVLYDPWKRLSLDKD